MRERSGTGRVITAYNPRMGCRLFRLLAVLLIAVLPWQTVAASRMIACAEPVPSAAAPCHEASMQDDATSHGAGKSAAWKPCSGCAQCQACTAAALPMTARDTLSVFPLQPVFTAPEVIAGVVLERLDRPPVG